MVNPALPVRSVKELVALARARPGQINFASSGAGGPMHLSGELLKITSQREVRERLAVFGLEVVGNTPDQFAEFIRTDVAKWSKLVRSIGLKTE